MRYEQARELCQGQEFAFPLAERDTHGPLPLPEHGAQVYCLAKVKPDIAALSRTDNVHDTCEVSITYERLDENCRKDRPNCAKCPVAKASHKLKSFNATISQEEYRRRDVSRFTPKI